MGFLSYYFIISLIFGVIIMTYSFKNYSEDNVFKSPIIIEIVGNITAALMWPISLFLLLRELYK